MNIYTKILKTYLSVVPTTKNYRGLTVNYILSCFNFCVKSKLAFYKSLYTMFMKQYYLLSYFINAIVNLRPRNIIKLIELIINGYSISESKSQVLYDACNKDIIENGNQCFTFFHIIEDKFKTHKTHILICSKINSNINYSDLTYPERSELSYILHLLTQIYGNGQIVMNLGEGFAELESFHCHFKSNDCLNVFIQAQTEEIELQQQYEEEQKEEQFSSTETLMDFSEEDLSFEE